MDPSRPACPASKSARFSLVRPVVSSAAATGPARLKILEPARRLRVEEPRHGRLGFEFERPFDIV